MGKIRHVHIQTDQYPTTICNISQKRLLSAKGKHNVTFHWVKGHDGHPQNERCDELATTAADGDELIVDEGV